MPMQRGFMDLVAVLDWHSPYVPAWEPSNILAGFFWLTALQRPLHHEPPEIFNTDQGCNSRRRLSSRASSRPGSASAWTAGSTLDSVFVERLWRTVKYEHICMPRNGSLTGTRDW